jgi:hypothetical protein
MAQSTAAPVPLVLSGPRDAVVMAARVARASRPSSLASPAVPAVRAVEAARAGRTARAATAAQAATAEAPGPEQTALGPVRTARRVATVEAVALVVPEVLEPPVDTAARAATAAQLETEATEPTVRAVRP